VDPPAPTNLGEYNFMKESVLEGLGATSKVITAAALVMCATVHLAGCGGCLSAKSPHYPRSCDDGHHVECDDATL